MWPRLLMHEAIFELPSLELPESDCKVLPQYRGMIAVFHLLFFKLTGLAAQSSEGFLVTFLRTL